MVAKSEVFPLEKTKNVFATGPEGVKTATTMNSKRDGTIKLTTSDQPI